MRKPETVSYYKHSAKIYKANDGFHATWYLNGKRVKKQFSTLRNAKESALEALRLIHKGEGDLAHLSPVKKAELIEIQRIFSEEKIISPLALVREYQEAKRIAPKTDLISIAKFWTDNNEKLERVTFKFAAEDWLKTKRPNWSKLHADKTEKRVERLCDVFSIDLLDIDLESVRTFFSVDLGKNAPKYKNHFRAILKSIFNYSIEQNWFPEKHRFTTILKNEKVPKSKQKIITPAQFKMMLDASDQAILPIIALRGFCGIRHAEALRLTWEDVWSKEGIIEIAIEKSKTKQRRTVPRCKALETWLKPYRRFNGIIWKQSDSVFGHAQNALHKLISVSGDNVLRDAYASYRLAITQSADQVSLEMGNSSDMVFTHYAEVVTPNAAQEWFSLLPKIESAAVVNIQA